jgi:hypothetical protein
MKLEVFARKKFITENPLPKIRENRWEIIVLWLRAWPMPTRMTNDYAHNRRLSLSLSLSLAPDWPLYQRLHIHWDLHHQWLRA